MDYVFSHLFDAGSREAQTLLASIGWLRENEERRRYFFELDGDPRYRQGSLLRRLWPTARVDAPADGDSPRQRGRRGTRRQEREAAGGRRQGSAGEERTRSAEETVSRSAFPAPHEILGVPADASTQEVRDAFRRLAVHYHPDKVAHLGEEFERVAHEKFLRLKEAYEVLLARRQRSG
jgi:DnaJ-domain-containing protein 1